MNNHAVFTRILTGLTAVFMLAGALASCANGDPEVEATVPDTEAATEIETEGRYPSPEPEDLGDFHLRIVTSNFRSGDRLICPEKREGEPINDAIYESRRKVEDAYHATLELCMYPGFGEVQDAIARSVSAGSHDFDLSLNHDNATVNGAMASNFVNLREYGDFDFEAPWWTRTVDSFTVAGKQYFASNYLTCSGILMSLIICYNKDLAAQRGIVIPYDKITNNEWTIDDLIALTQDVYVDLNGDGKMTHADDLYGFATQWQGAVTMQVSLGCSTLVKDEDGMLTFRPDEERLTAISEKWTTLMNVGYLAEGENSAEGEYALNYFADGKILFDYLEVRNVFESLRDTSFAMGFLPVPKLNTMQDHYITGSYDLYWAILQSSIDDADKISRIEEALACNCYYDILPIVYEVTLKLKLSDSPQDAVTFDILRDSLLVDTGYAFNEYINGMSTVVRALYEAKTSGIGSLIAKSERQVTKALGNFAKKWEKLP